MDILRLTCCIQTTVKKRRQPSKSTVAVLQINWKILVNPSHRDVARSRLHFIAVVLNEMKKLEKRVQVRKFVHITANVLFLRYDNSQFSCFLSYMFLVQIKSKFLLYYEFYELKLNKGAVIFNSYFVDI